MSRFYDIAVTPLAGTANSQQNPAQKWTSHPGNPSVFDPGALNVQLDILTGPQSAPASQTGATITIEGIDFNSLQQSSQYAGMKIVVSGGMKAPGLPLISPEQAGVILRGQIVQSFGNWRRTEMNLNFVVFAGRYTFYTPGLFVLTCPPGTPMTTAIQNMLRAAYPGLPAPSIAIQNPSQYVYDYPIGHHCYTLSQMSDFIKSKTKSASSGGIIISLLPRSEQLYVYDNSMQGQAIQLNFTDLIGQPQWVGGENNSYVLQFMTVMRSDIAQGALVQMPQSLAQAYGPGSVQTNAGANQYGQLKLKAAFQGQFLIQDVRHIGNFRDIDGASWATVFNAVPNKVPV